MGQTMLLISIIGWLASPIVLGPIFVYRFPRKKQAQPPIVARLLGFAGLELLGISMALLLTSELGWHLPPLGELPWRTGEIALTVLGFILGVTGFAYATSQLADGDDGATAGGIQRQSSEAIRQ